jgi:hypothetical protein
MDDAQGGHYAPKVPPQQHPWSGPGQVTQPVLAAYPSSPLPQGLTDAFQHNPKVVVILDKLKDIDHDVSGAGISHDTLHLTHLV